VGSQGNVAAFAARNLNDVFEIIKNSIIPHFTRIDVGGF